MNKKPVFGDDIQTLYRLIKKMDFDEGEGTKRFKILDVYDDMIRKKLILKSHSR